ncbi:MAG: RNA polymerase sigma factor [Oscillospiraceae bacterium]|nr:RNA polymerase sigma factor [Oscillospiraceae bacterium]
MEDQIILDMYFAREESAIIETKQKYGQRLLNTSMNILNSYEDAEECVNDTLLKAWDAIPPTRPTSFGAYLAKISRNLSINKWESGNTIKRGGGTIPLLLSELEDCIPASGGLEEEWEMSFLTETINEFLSTVNQTARVAFTLRYFHGESIQSISKQFKISESKTKSILFRVRKKLKIHLEKEGII